MTRGPGFVRSAACYRAIVVAACFGGSVMWNGPAGAAAGPQAAEPSSGATITVVAPEIVRRSERGRRMGQSVEVISLTRAVSFEDLDLRKPSDQAALRSRVRSTAAAACKELDEQSQSKVVPGHIPGEQSKTCRRTASAEAIQIANQVIAAANVQ